MIETAKIRRALEMTIASLLLIAAFPLLVAITLAIKIETAGPVFVIERLHGETRYKFRTTTAVYDSYHPRRQVIRLTHVGEFLRDTNLDELPALINILRGEASLIRI